jgi:UPF0755 protein
MRARRVLLAVLAILALAAAGGGLAMREARQRYDAPGPLAKDTAFVVPHGTNAELATALAEAGIVADARDFRIAAWLTARAGPLRAAEFAFSAHASLRQVLVILRTARPVQHMLTIPEGLTAAQIAELLARTDGLTGEIPVPPEGSVLPQTYAYERGMTRAAVLARATAAMQRTLARVWQERAEGLPLALPAQMVTLASIIERETARPEERARVAAVFLNRLRRGMKLQSDPTVIYAVTGGEASGGRTLTKADLAVDSPYNTYRVAGLPPGPIGSPGLAALEAVARPANTDELYFVADGHGGHVFARTLEEHNRNVARWLGGTQR